MDRAEFSTYVKKYFPLLNESNLIEELYKHASFKSIKEGTILMDLGNYIRTIPLVVKGSIKIVRENESGNELLMYYLGEGDTCAMSLTCCMSHNKSEIRAIAESDVELFMIPVEKVDEWMFKFRSWKSFIMQTYSKRFAELLTTIDSIAFLKMDERLKKYLINKSDKQSNKVISITHQEIAVDLNTSREVVSRLLKQLEKKGDVILSRNKISLID